MDGTAPTRDDIVNLITSDHETLRRSFAALLDRIRDAASHV